MKMSGCLIKLFLLLVTFIGSLNVVYSVRMMPGKVLLGLLMSQLPVQGEQNVQENVIERVEVDVVVVGSGITGATAAFYLNQSGVDVVLTEARETVGGNMISRKGEGYIWEEGPNTFQPNPTILRLAKDVGALEELVLADPTLPRFVFWNKKLHALPSGLKDIFTFQLLSWSGKIRAGLGFAGFIRGKPKHEESIEEFASRHLGQETFERIIDPFVSGIYAGNPRKLSMKAALRKIYELEGKGLTKGLLFGAIRKVRKLRKERKERRRLNLVDPDADLPKIPFGSLGSFQFGLQTIPLKIQQKLDNRVLTSHKLLSIVKEESTGRWISRFQTNNGVKEISSKHILVTTPAYEASKVLAHQIPEVKELEKIHYPAVGAAVLAYPNTAFKIPLKGFGHLIPRAMNIRTLGTIWASSLFPGRAPEGYSILVNFIGGSQDLNITQLSNEEIVQQIHQDNQKIILHADAPMPKVLGVRIWPRAIPQYEIGHNDLLEKVFSVVQKEKGLHLGGNYRTGASIGDCIQFGKDIANEIRIALTSMP